MVSDKLIIGDIHGMGNMLDTLLNEWRTDSEQLIFLGDYIDRGTQSKKVLETAICLKEEYGAILLKGNHEDMLLQWLDNPEDLAHFYLGQGGFETLKSFGINSKYTYRKQADMFKFRYKELIESIHNMELYVQDNKHIYVHAGINPNVKMMEDMDVADLLWIRESFFYREHQFDKRVIFGHTPTRLINKSSTNNVWISQDKSKIGIDGGAVSGGYLVGLRIKESNYEVIYVNQDNKVIHNVLHI